MHCNLIRPLWNSSDHGLLHKKRQVAQGKVCIHVLLLNLIGSSDYKLIKIKSNASENQKKSKR